jgi:hypothetical protein
MTSRLANTNCLRARWSRPRAQRAERCFGEARRGRDGAARHVLAHGCKGGHHFRSAAPGAHECRVGGGGQAAGALAAVCWGGRGWHRCWFGPVGLLDFVGEEHWPTMYAAEEALHVIVSSGPRFFFCQCGGRIRTLMTPKLANLRISMPRLRTSWSCIHSKTVFPGRIRVYKRRSFGQSGIDLPWVVRGC